MTLEERIKAVKPGDAVIYHDPTGGEHNAVCTVNWGTCINLVFVSGDESKQDTYGRQIERQTSLCHKDEMRVHGFYWRFADEEPNPYTPPIAR